MALTLRWLLGPVGRYVLAAAVVLAAALWLKHEIEQGAVDAAKVEELRKEIGRVEKSTDADADARRCAADPACRLLDDGWRRD